MSGTPALATLALLLAAAAPAAAQAPLSVEQRSAALSEVRRQVQSFYVFPEKRAAIVAALDRAEASGRYALASPTVFAEAVSEDLQAATRDGHLRLRYDPAWYAEAKAPAGPGGADPGVAAAERRRAARGHHGLDELRLLPGNVRYLKISGFAWNRDETGAAYDGAMRFLRDGDAIVLDLRGNGGGDHAAVRYLVSHFLDEDVLLYTFLSQKQPSAESRTLGYLPAGRLTGKPLFVLIDGGTASAGEDLAYQVEQYRLGTLVGATTAGAANNNEHVPIAPGFLLSLSIGRPVHPLSGGNWEGEGVRPAVACPPAQALDRALELALAELATSGPADPLSRAEVAWAREDVEARLRPIPVSAEHLRILAGRFGLVTVAFQDGALWMTRPGREAARLLPMSEGLFAVDGRYDLRVRLAPDALSLLRLGAPEPRVFPRS